MKVLGQKKLVRRVGILSGTFDPVHSGHIAFALQTLKAARLDVIYFLPERRPRRDERPEHFAHRVAMLRAALKPHRALQIMELPDTAFSVQYSLPRIARVHPYAELVFLVGSDVLPQISGWKDYERLITEHGLAVGLRGGDTVQDVLAATATWSCQPSELVVVDSFARHINSTDIRRSLRHNRYVAGLLASVWRYCGREWLYVALPHKLPGRTKRAS